MDGDLWAARMLASKHQQMLQASQSLMDRHLSLDDLECDDDIRPDFVCPYCYEEFDIATLCSHLEDEHCFEAKPVMCPICAAKIRKDLIGHITLQHNHLFKVQRRRRFRKSGGPSHATLSFLGKELGHAQLQALLGGGPSRSESSNASASDPLLSTLVYNLPLSEADDGDKQSAAADSSLKVTTANQPKTSFESTLTAEEREQKLKQATLRAKFVQQLVLSTIWSDN
ncbi:hypothetical protein O6H91_17G041200 [Diphasiastrum complanatum]|uniref:Uncharacterized protein n=2 Tax=Diphasiastrum complanatum TaxID=34168 RepID=A0ACC2B5Y3_DIPCM|nr:hypothetical protein O6H91_17G041200 [Diphasiastrum complanatum]KAJ7525199.1 hypothetical protein O6H91_17G041200 [Diphasiastrum complanatum]